MHKISWEALIARFAPILDVGLIQFTCASNSVKNSFDLLLLDHSLEVLGTVQYTQRKTCVDR